MEFDVYCDESHTDVLCSHSTHAKYLIIGSLWLRTDGRDSCKSGLHQLREKHDIRRAEVKWQKVSPNKLGFYIDLIDWFFTQGTSVRFRCIAVDRQHVNLVKFHDNDHELAFYKFYYQVLHHWILDFNQYNIFCDHKSNRDGQRLPVLSTCLNNSNLSSEIQRVQAIRSSDSVLLQLADVLTGAVSAKLNGSLKSDGAKQSVVDRLEQRLGRAIGHTWMNEPKFNVFVINLQGGW